MCECVSIDIARYSRRQPVTDRKNSNNLIATPLNNTAWTALQSQLGRIFIFHFQRRCKLIEEIAWTWTLNTIWWICIYNVFFFLMRDAVDVQATQPCTCAYGNVDAACFHFLYGMLYAGAVVLIDLWGDRLTMRCGSLFEPSREQCSWTCAHSAGRCTIKLWSLLLQIKIDYYLSIELIVVIGTLCLPDGRMGDADYHERAWINHMFMAER